MLLLVLITYLLFIQFSDTLLGVQSTFQISAEDMVDIKTDMITHFSYAIVLLVSQF